MPAARRPAALCDGGAGGTGSNAAHALLERTFAGSEVLRIDGRAPKHIAPLDTGDERSNLV